MASPKKLFFLQNVLKNKKKYDKMEKIVIKDRMEVFVRSDKPIKRMDLDIEFDDLLDKNEPPKTLIGKSEPLQGKDQNIKSVKNIVSCNATENMTGLIQIELQRLSVDLIHATNYLIQLFYATNKKYTCTRTKLGKMLSIAAFVYARKGQMLFDENIYKYKDCGTAIKELQVYDQVIYTPDEFSDNSLVINVADSNATIENLDSYKVTNLSDDIKATLGDVFCNFGSYPASKLGDNLGMFLDLILDDEDSNKIDLTKILHINHTDFSETNDHLDVLNYILRY